MNTVEVVIRSVKSFYVELCLDKNGRYRSWEHCYKVFHDARKTIDPDIDYLSLHLAFYLASWGMYRGSSFLLQKDYKVHIPIVQEILKDKYDCLFGIRCKDYRNYEVKECFLELIGFMSSYYDEIRKQVNSEELKNDISMTLISKILMGTLGCVPAYDRFFIDAVKEYKVTTGNFNYNSILKLVDFYEANENNFEQIRNKLKVYDLLYPQMKIIDMGFWQIGYEIDKEKKVK